MRTTVLVWLVLLSVLLASAAVAGDEAKVRLLNKFDAGNQIAYELKMSGSGTTTITAEGAEEPVATVPMEFTGVLAMLQKVVQMYDDGSAAVQVITDNLEMHIRVTPEEGAEQEMDLTIAGDRMTMSGPDGTQEIDLAAAGMDTAMMGMDMRMRMTPRGDILWFSAEGLERLSQMTGMDLSQMMRPSETPFPDRDLAPGDSWDYDVEFPIPGGTQNARMDMTAELVSVARQNGGAVAKISMNGDIDLSGMKIDAPGGEGQTVQVTFDEMKEALTGTYDFDLERGVTTAATYDVDLTTRMRTPAGPAGSPVSTITTDMKITVEMVERK